MPRHAQPKGGCSGGREAVDLCPHSVEATPYLPFLECYTARIRKELNALAGPQKSQSSPDLSTSGMPPREYFPIGGRNPLNNNSYRMKDVMQPPVSKIPASSYNAMMGHVPEKSHVDALVQLSRAEMSKAAAAHQISAVRQRGEGTLLGLAHAGQEPGRGTQRALAEAMRGRPATEPNPGARTVSVQKGSLNTAARADGRGKLSGAAAQQLSAVRQRGVGTIIRLGKLPEDQLEQARQQGHGTLIAVAEAAKEALHPALQQQQKRELVRSCGRETLLRLHPAL